MQEPTGLLVAVRAVATRRGVYTPEAYLFVLEALDRILSGLKERRHVSGADLLEGIKQLGRDRFGVMATDVFHEWGVRGTLDFGRIVFHLVEADLLSKQDEDSLSDFIDKFDFRQVFEQEYFLGRT
ncbi:MAG: hypothetical protein R6X25_00520 [Candidatus Krumholzibacteriia bacterium]